MEAFWQPPCNGSKELSTKFPNTVIKNIKSNSKSSPKVTVVSESDCRTFLKNWAICGKYFVVIEIQSKEKALFLSF